MTTNHWDYEITPSGGKPIIARIYLAEKLYASCRLWDKIHSSRLPEMLPPKEFKKLARVQSKYDKIYYKILEQFASEKEAVNYINETLKGDKPNFWSPLNKQRIFKMENCRKEAQAIVEANSKRINKDIWKEIRKANTDMLFELCDSGFDEEILDALNRLNSTDTGVDLIREMFGTLFIQKLRPNDLEKFYNNFFPVTIGMMLEHLEQRIRFYGIRKDSVYQVFEFNDKVQEHFYKGDSFIGMQPNVSANELNHRVMASGREGFMPELVSRMKETIHIDNCHFYGFHIHPMQHTFLLFFYIKKSAYEESMQQLEKMFVHEGIGDLVKFELHTEPK